MKLVNNYAFINGVFEIDSKFYTFNETLVDFKNFTLSHGKFISYGQLNRCLLG